MHEVSIAQALMDQIVGICQREGAQRVLRATITVGSLSGVDPGALEFAFPIVAQNTVAQDAQLVIQRVSARFSCRTCGAQTEPATPFPLCPDCGSADVIIEGGKDLILNTVDLSS